MDIFTQGLETERMYLIPLQENHAEDMLYGLDEEVTKYMSVSPYKDISPLQERVKEKIQEIQNHRRIILAGIEKQNSEFVWAFDITKIGNPELKAGIRVKKAFHRKWYGREGMLALIQWVKENIEFDYILYPVDKDNLSSRKIAELADGILDVDKSGNEIVEREKMDDGKILNLVHYRIYKK